MDNPPPIWFPERTLFGAASSQRSTQYIVMEGKKYCTSAFIYGRKNLAYGLKLKNQETSSQNKF